MNYSIITRNRLSSQGGGVTSHPSHPLDPPLVWSRPWSDTVRPTALVLRPRPGSLQASSDSSPVSERPRTTVSVGALHPGLQCWHAPASAFRQPSPTCRTALSVCPDSCGTRWGSWFQAILCHISAHFRHLFGVYAVRIFFKMPHKTDVPKQQAAA